MSDDPRLHPEEPPVVRLVCTGTADHPHKRHVLATLVVGVENVRVQTSGVGGRAAGVRPGPSGVGTLGAVLVCRFGDYGPQRLAQEALYALGWAAVESGRTTYDVHRDPDTLSTT